jgi:S-sulfo-L-cysteine synthase (O-acetyl-L-serine-dependent)
MTAPVTESVLDLIGDTPLVRLRNLPDVPERVRIYGKLEGRNPGGSVKDRAALSMILGGERDGRLHPGKTILESSSGNTAIGLALVGHVKGYPVELVMPKSVSIERRRLCEAYGATLVLSDPFEGSDGAQRLARWLAAENPDRYFYTAQYDNPENPLAHYRTTALEVWQQTRGLVTHFVAGIGTSGTLGGAGRRLRELDPGVRIVAVEPNTGLHGIEGLKHMATAIRPSIYDESIFDEKVPCSTEDAVRFTELLLEREGIFGGHSCGAALYGAVEVARRLEEGVIVAIFPDGGERYLSLKEAP